MQSETVLINMITVTQEAAGHDTNTIQMGICRARLTNCPGALTNVRMLCETGEL